MGKLDQEEGEILDAFEAGELKKSKGAPAISQYGLTQALVVMEKKA